MKILKVPYISQWDADANFSRDDCVPTCSAMMIAYYGGSVSVNKIAEKTGQGLVDFNEIQAALKSFNYNIIGTSFRTIDDFKKSIDSGIPVLCIIHYGDLPNRQDTGYSGGHAVVGIGYEEVDGKITKVYVNDPDFYSPRRNEGASKEYAAADFIKAWQSKADGNNPGNMWYLDNKVPVTGLDIKADIPSEVEEAYDLKTFDWYDKHWTFEDFIKDSIETHADFKNAKDDLKETKRDLDLARTSLDEDVKKFIAKDDQIKSLQKTNAENTAQLTVMGDQVKEANRQKQLAETAKTEAETNLTNMTTDRDAYKKQVTTLNDKLVKNLKGYSKGELLRALFGFF